MLPIKSIHGIAVLGGEMVFDPCPHQITQIILKAGAEFRRLKGLPEENNITALYNETAPILGVIPKQTSSLDISHLPSPSEMKDESGGFIVPRKNCPKCGGTMVLGPICQSCEDAEGGKYKSGYKCEACQLVDDKNEMFFSQRLVSMGIEVPEGIKQALGIKTLVDEGLK
jgi:hypothetical protein